jgi:chromosome transmission fidelity protein 18
VLSSQAPTRYAVRQVLDQELHKTIVLRENAARQARFQSGAAAGGIQNDYGFDDKENQTKGPAATGKGAATVAVPLATSVKRDFFGRVVADKTQQHRPLGERDGNSAGARRKRGATGSGGAVPAAGKVWVTYHEGLNNAVTKPISLDEFLRGF